MTDNQFRHLTSKLDHLATQTASVVEGQQRLERLTADFAARTEERFRRLGDRLTRLEVRVEAMQDDIKGLADGIRSLRERLDRFEAETERRFSQMDGRMTRFQAETMRRFSGVDRRLDALEAKVA